MITLEQLLDKMSEYEKEKIFVDAKISVLNDLINSCYTSENNETEVVATENNTEYNTNI